MLPVPCLPYPTVVTLPHWYDISLFLLSTHTIQLISTIALWFCPLGSRVIERYDTRNLRSFLPLSTAPFFNFTTLTFGPFHLVFSFSFFSLPSFSSICSTELFSRSSAVGEAVPFIFTALYHCAAIIPLSSSFQGLFSLFPLNVVFLRFETFFLSLLCSIITICLRSYHNLLTPP